MFVMSRHHVIRLTLTIIPPFYITPSFRETVKKNIETFPVKPRKYRFNYVAYCMYKLYNILSYI